VTARDAELARFLSRMSHELRTPLNAILGFAQLLDMDAHLTPDEHEAVRQILHGGRHLLDLVNEVLDISRIESGELALSPEPIWLDDVVTGAAELLKPLAMARRVTVDVAPLPADLPPIVADRRRLSQVLLNLLSNAIKYNQRDGRVTVALDRIDDRVRIAVRDTGPGIPAAKLELIFQPFERLEAAQTGVDGTGLGLPLARALTAAMGGTLGVESRVGEGSTFWVDLPAAPANARAEPEAGPAPPPRPGYARSAVILYIEDNPSNVRLMERVLQQRPGLALLHAAQGRQGLEIARRRRPDVVLLDLHLPDMSGDDVVRELWQDAATRAIPVVVVTADATPGTAVRLKAAGAVGVLTKPIDVRGVLGVLDSLLGDGPAERTGTS
jgi:CheY-like chemotaxis protein